MTEYCTCGKPLITWYTLGGKSTKACSSITCECGQNGSTDKNK